jgi:hypothetical protein
LHQINKQVSRTLSELVQWALEMHPDDRPATVADFQKALFGDGVRPKKVERLVVGSGLRQALQVNAAMALFVLLLLLLAVALTIR